MQSILDKGFKYVPAAKTDIKATFRKERERLKRQSELPTAKVITPGAFLLKSRGGK